MKYFAVTADIVASRENIQENEKRINHELQIIQNRYYEFLSSDIRMRSGDEIQVVVSEDNCKILPSLVRELRYAVLPLSIRVGIGLGSIYNIEVQTSNPFELNGEAFYNARDAVTRTKQKKQETVNYETYLEYKDANVLSINIQFRTLDIFIGNWTWEMHQIAMLEKFNSQEASKLSQLEIASELYTMREIFDSEKGYPIDENIHREYPSINIDYKNIDVKKVILSIKSNISKNKAKKYYYEVLEIERNIVLELRKLVNG